MQCKVYSTKVKQFHTCTNYTIFSLYLAANILLTVCRRLWACSGTPWIAASMTAIHSCIASWSAVKNKCTKINSIIHRIVQYKVIFLLRILFSYQWSDMMSTYNNLCSKYVLLHLLVKDPQQNNWDVVLNDSPLVWYSLKGKD